MINFEKKSPEQMDREKKEKDLEEDSWGGPWDQNYSESIGKTEGSGESWGGNWGQKYHGMAEKAEGKEESWSGHWDQNNPETVEKMESAEENNYKKGEYLPNQISEKKEIKNPPSEKLAGLVFDILKRKELLNREGIKFEKEVDQAYRDMEDLLEKHRFVLTDPETLKRIRERISNEVTSRGGTDRAMSNVLDVWSMIEKRIENEKLDVIPKKDRIDERYERFSL